MARNTLGLACSSVSGICVSVNASFGELCFVKTVAKKTGVAVAGQFTRMLWEYLVSRENVSNTDSKFLLGTHSFSREKVVKNYGYGTDNICISTPVPLECQIDQDLKLLIKFIY